MSHLFTLGALWLANLDSMQSAYQSLEESSPINRMFRQKAKEFEGSKQAEKAKRVIDDAVTNYTIEKQGAIGAALYLVGIAAFVLRFCDVFVGSTTLVWCVLGAMVVDRVMGLTTEWKPEHFTAAFVVLVSAALVGVGLGPETVSGMLDLWAWAATLYRTIVDHLHNDVSDHDQARIFLAGMYLSTVLSMLVRLLARCRSVTAFLGVAFLAVAVVMVRVAVGMTRMYHARTRAVLTRLDQWVLYGVKLFLYRMNAVFRFLVGAGGRFWPLPLGFSATKLGTSYRYETLSKDQIRVLNVLPGHPCAPIRCRLDTVCLKEEFGYQALSYVWGRGEPTHWIIIEQPDGQEAVLHVGANAHAVLRQIRSAWIVRTVWIDGVCINQQDKTEKAAQVQMMGEIYERAWRVTAYLGPSPTAHLVQSLLAKIRFLQQGRGMSFLQMREHLLAEYDVKTWEAISEFLRNEWFNRVWIVQEAALARQLHLLHGNICMDWETINQSAQFLVQDVTRTLFRFEQDAHPPVIPGSGSGVYRGLDGICAMLELRGDFEAPAKMTLGLALRCSLSFNATDPRDKVFGLLALIKDPKITADYDIACHDVYRNTMRQILVSDRNIEALNFAGNGRREPDPDLPVPSWVSDWKRSSQSGLYNKTYTAATTQPASLLSVPEHPNLLFVKGWTRDAIHLLSDVLEVSGSSASPLDLSSLKTWHNTAKSMTIDHATSYPADQRFEVYIRTMIGDRSSSSADDDDFVTPPTTSKCTEMHTNFLRYCNESTTTTKNLAEILDMYNSTSSPFRQLLNNSLGDGTSNDKIPPVIEKLEEYMQTSYQVAQSALEFLALSRHVFRNRFCITEQGRTAVVPPETKAGDIIVLLAGARMPFVLRPRGKVFELLGCCYVHGLMEGGGAGAFEDKWKVFGLR